MKLTKIEIENLYGCMNYSINLLDQTFLVGKNGAGKSSILRIIDAFFSKKTSFFQNLNFKKISLFFEGNKRKENFYIELIKRKEKRTIQRENEIETIEVENCIISDSRMTSYMETIYKERQEKLFTELRNNEAHSTDENLKKELEEINNSLENIDSIKFISPFSAKDYYDRFMKDEDIKFLSNGVQYIDDRKKYLSSIINKNISFSDGEDTIKELEDILNPINIVNKLWQKAIKEYLENLLDGKTEFILIDYINIVNQFLKDTGKEIYLSKNRDLKIRLIKYPDNLDDLKIEDLSSGEMELLILFTKIYFSFNQNSIIIFDEPEKSLHIEWQVLLGEFFKEFSEKHKDAQLIIATHSPFVTQEVDNNSIISMDEILNIEYTVENKGDL
ncbi:AAA family ATPase [Fusobacterium canifelinum]|uniref:AAA family ATPase n=1 Tax=Fusobacterium canifelinum TaxID=285729 RepID=A0A7T4KGQ0_9FUSO|nr:ATP-binding protein [Fusobacterium canifelinum]QQB74094.1 AAA family ATPase [Fusobacterium canifelinum]